MSPSMEPKKKKQIRTRPHLMIEIKKGWHFDENMKQFVSNKEQRIEIKSNLPPKSKIEFKIPQLAKKKKRSLSEDEIDLLKHFILILPSGSDPSDYEKIVKNWPCVKEVQLPSDVGLPE